MFRFFEDVRKLCMSVVRLVSDRQKANANETKKWNLNTVLCKKLVCALIGVGAFVDFTDLHISNLAIKYIRENAKFRETV